MTIMITGHGPSALAGQTRQGAPKPIAPHRRFSPCLIFGPALLRAWCWPSRSPSGGLSTTMTARNIMAFAGMRSKSHSVRGSGRRGQLISRSVTLRHSAPARLLERGPVAFGLPRRFRALVRSASRFLMTGQWTISRLALVPGLPMRRHGIGATLFLEVHQGLGAGRAGLLVRDIPLERRPLRGPAGSWGAAALWPAPFAESAEQCPPLPVIGEVQPPSRRRAPIWSGWVQASASRTVFSLYAAVNCRRGMGERMTTL
jgi:hypothetical protein